MRFVVCALLAIALSGLVHAAEPSKDESSSIKVLSFVALAEPKLPSAASVRAALQERLGAMKIADMETDEEQVILFRIRGGTVMVGLLDAPLPKDELEFACKWAWYWRAACDVMASHRAHLHVAVLGTDLDKVGAALLQTHVVASLMDSDANAIASYWRTSLHSRESFLKQSAYASRETLPIWLWINFRLTSDLEKGWTLSTDGMEEFDLYEIESKDANVDGKKLFTLAVSTADYLIKNGPVIKDGDTIGGSAHEKIPVRHAPSYWHEGKTVYRVVFPDR